MAGQYLTDAQRKKLLDEKRQGAHPNNWVKDLGGALKKVGHGAAEAVDKASDVLIDKQAWSDIAHGKGDVSDYANAALDASMLIPGAGLVGGAARVGARIGAKELAKEGARVAERKLSPMAERAAARAAEKSPTAAEGLLARLTGRSTGKRVASGATHRAEGAAKGPLDSVRTSARNKFEDVATKQERGIGRKIGMGQTKKRLALTGGATVGANLLTRAYDEGAFGGEKQAPAAKGDIVPSTAAEGGQPSYLIGNALYPVAVDSGGGLSIPASTQRALAEYLNKGGSPDGAQVVYLGH